MSRATVQFNDYISLAVMLLMFVALLGGQSGAAAEAAERAASVAPVAPVASELLRIDFDGHIGHREFRINIVADKELSHFRGEDE